MDVDQKMNRLQAAILATMVIAIISGVFVVNSLIYHLIPTSGRVETPPQFFADSGSIADIQAAVDQAAEVDGDVIIPAGDWSDNYNEGTGNIVWIPGGVNVFGSGYSGEPGTGVDLTAWNTVLRMSSQAQDGTYMFRLDASNGKASRISGIAFVGHRRSSPPFRGYGGVGIGDVPSPSMRDFRVDHCYFSDMGYDGVAVGGRYSRGLVDHCEFWNIMKGTTYSNTIHIGYGVGYDARYGFNGWISDIRPHLGTYEDGIIYVEDCYFDGVRHGVVAYALGRLVIRHCTFDRMHIQYQSGYTDCHGAYPDSYGGRCIEVYDNKFYFTIDDTVPWQGTDIPKAARMRGGGGVFCDNEVYDMDVAVEIDDDDGNSAHPENYVHQFWIWNNTLGSGVTLIDNQNSHVKIDQDYFLRAPTLAQDGFTFQKYAYPHPLQGG